LQKLKKLCHDNGALIILDEIITGFRWHLNGAQKLYGVVPDLSTFGKAMANGFSLSALVGKKEIMELGGLHHDKERVFLLSTTYGAEYHTLAAAIETMRVYKNEQVVERLYEQGEKLRQGINNSVQELGLGGYFEITGRPCCMVFATKDQQNQHSQPFRTLFLQETINRGLVMPSLIVSYSHTDQDIKETVDKVHDALIIYKKALNEGVEKYLNGKSVKPVYRKFN
jgi:glutamate-1-semialdehyde 2,1-aminomutase